MDTSEGQKSKYAVWQDTYRRRKKAAGFKLISIYAPIALNARIRRLLKFILPPAESETPCPIEALEKLVDVTDAHARAVFWRDADGWHCCELKKAPPN